MSEEGQMTKKIYFIGGRFQDDEQRDIFWNKYGLMLKQVYNYETKRDRSLRDFKFIPVYKCDREEFERIWIDPNTYGIFWFSHGTPEGYPVAHHYKLDDEPWERLTAREWEASLLKPENLEKSSRNLRFVSFMGCRTGRLAEKWQQKMPAGAQFLAFRDDMWAGEGTARTSLDDWIKNDLLLRKPKTPTEGARYLFQFLTGSLELAGSTPQYPAISNLIGQKRPLKLAITAGVQKTGLSTPQVNVRPFPTLSPQAVTLPLIQQRQQMEAQRRRMQEEAQRRTQQQFETQQRHTQELMKTQRRQAQEEAERRRTLQEAQRRAQEEAERRRAQEEAERRRAQEEAQHRAREEAQRRQLALDLARIKKPFIPTVRPHIWEPPLKTRIFIGGPPYIGGVPMGGDPRPDFIEKIKTRW
jgi:hypothetical protein